MASVIASLVGTHPTSNCKYVASPTSYPSWTSPQRDFLETKRTFTGFSTIWTTHDTTRLCITDDETPHAISIAYFPPLNTPLHPTASHTARNAFLVTTTNRFITIATPGADAFRISLGDPLTDPHAALNILPMPRGILLCTAYSPFYHFLSHPLHAPLPLSLPLTHTILQSFIDLPLLVTRAESTLVVWSCTPIDKPIPPGSPIPGHANIITAPDLQLTQLYKTSVHPTNPVSAFLSHDTHGLLSLCIVSDSVLTGLSVSQSDDSSFHISPSFRIRDVTSAVPVLAVRRLHACLDALVRHADGSLSLFMGRNRLCAVNLPEAASVLSASDTTLGQPVADEFSLVRSDGHATRFSLLHACYASPLVNHCLAAITFAFENIGAITRTTALYHDLLCARADLITVDGPPPAHVEWSLFENVLLKVAPLASGSGPAAGEKNARADVDGWNALSSGLEEEDAGDSHWDALLESQFHEAMVTSNKDFSVQPSPRSERCEHHLLPPLPDTSIPHADTLRQVLSALHLLYEDRKLSVLSGHICRQLANLNYRLASLLGDFSFIDHYRRDFPDLLNIPLRGPCNSSDGETGTVPSVMEYLAAKVCNDASNTISYPAVSSNSKLDCKQDRQLTASWRRESPFELTRRVLNYYEIMFGEESLTKEAEERYERILLAMVGDNITTADIDAMPFGIALPLRDVLWHCRHHPNANWPYAAFDLIGREDLFNFSELDMGRQQVGDENLNFVQESRALLQIHAAAAPMDDATEKPTPSVVEEENARPSLNNSQQNRKPYVEDDGDGCDMHGDLFRLRFGEDRRLDEVRRILRSTDFTIMTPVLKTDQDSSAEFDLLSRQKAKLECLLRKRFAAPVGRGAFTLRTYAPTCSTKPLSAPKICMTGRLFAQSGPKVTYSPTDSNSFQWGEFHNGVAAGLRIVAADVNRGSETGRILTRSLIVNQRPSDIAGSATHAGMLLALGLGGYLPVLRKTDYYQYLVPRHELTAIGLMLGLGAGNVACADENISKMLCLHVRPFNPSGFSVPEFYITVNVQTAAALGLGLLHMGSCDNFLLDGLFTELGRRLKPGDIVDNREGLVLAAGFGIGLICLGHGSSAFNAVDRSRIDRLVLLANGGSTNGWNVPNGHSNRSAFKSGDVGNPGGSIAASADSETSRVLEGSYVNTDVVSPGALMALMLIYMKTNNKRLAERLIIPDTLYSLDRARPDHVYLRLLARSIIMWDDIEASDAWICRSIPTLLLPVNETKDPFDLQGLASLGQVDPAHRMDLHGTLAARGFAVAGACSAIALKYAGTGNSRAVDVLTRECEAFESALLKRNEAHNSLEYVYSTGLCCAALGLGIVTAGSGDLKVFRLLRRLRKRSGQSETYGRYGSHIAMHMSIGFLFLGGGCQTFGTSKIAVVGLLCAIYPQFPRDIDDNQYHLQAFRHLYVLAVEPRCVATQDVDTGRWCSVDVEIGLKDGEVVSKRSPCIVPEAGLIDEVRVVGDRYLGTRDAINRAVPGRGWYSSCRSQILFVKRKTGHLPFSADPKGSKGILARSLNRRKPSDSDDASYFTQIQHLVKAFSADPEILAFVKYFCKSDGRNGNERCVEMLYECLSNDKPDAVKIYLDILSAAEALREGNGMSAFVHSLVLAEGYLLSPRACEKRLVRRDFITGVLTSIRQHVLDATVCEPLLTYIVTGGRKWAGSCSAPDCGRADCLPLDERSRHTRNCLSIVLRLNRIPPPAALTEFADWVRRKIPLPAGSRAGAAVRSAGDALHLFDGLVDRRLLRVNDCAVQALLDALEMQELTKCNKN